MALTTTELQTQVLTYLQEDTVATESLFATSEIQSFLANACKETCSVLAERDLEPYAVQSLMTATASQDTYTLGTDVLRVVAVGVKYTTAATTFTMSSLAHQADRRMWEWNTVLRPSTSSPKHILNSTSAGAGTTQTLQMTFYWSAVPSVTVTSGIEVWMINGADGFGDGGVLLSSEIAPLFAMLAAADLAYKDDMADKAQTLYGRWLESVNHRREQYGLEPLREWRRS